MARYRETEWLAKNKKEIIYNVKPQDYHDFVIEIITNCNLKELRSFYSFLNKNEKLKHLLARTKIENPSQLCITSICAQAYNILGQRTPYDNIILWVQMTLESNNEKINYYIRKKNEFEKNRLLSNVDECHLILNEIERKFGYSWWAIESRLSLIQDTEGKKQRVKYIRELISISKKRGIFYWVAQELSEKNDEKTQENRYCDRIKENFDSLDIPKAWSDNLYFRTTRRNDIQALPTLILESFGNIIDLYERYTVFCTILTQTETLSPIIAKTIRSLCKKIECKTLRNCLSTVDNACKNKLKKHYSVSECGRLYLQGNFNESCELAINNILENPTDIESLQILSFFDNYEINDKLNETVIGGIIKNLRKVRKFNDNTPEAYSKIRKFTWNNMDLPFSHQLNSIILNKSNLSTIEITSVNDYFLYSNSLDIITAPQLGCDYYDIEQIHPSIKNIREIIKLNRNEKYDEVVTKIKSIINEECEIININKAFLLHSLCISLIQTNDIFSSMKEIVDNSIKNRFLLSILPIKELIKGKRWKDFKNYKDNIELSIILHFYLILHEDSLQKTNLGFAWDWYRKSLGLINVSDIQLNDSSTTEREKAIYYLSEISTPETMEGHTEGLDTPLQTLISRSQILAKLIELDKSRDKSYEKEQVSLLKAISIQKGLDKLNQNKLYIDENIIKSWAQRELESSYEKYQEILIHPELNISENEASLSSDDEDKLISLIEKMVNINKEEHVTLFNSIAKEYLMNKQGGLNLFLSMRIRHGKLESTLRKPLSDSNLITKMSDGNVYLDNSYWIKKLGLDGEDAELLNERFRRLSNLFDTSINTFKEHRIRCYSPTNMHGVFYVNPTIDDYDDLKRKIASGVNFGTFCDESIKLCRRSIEGNLPRTKLLIESEIINLIIFEINDLLEYSEYKSYKPLSESIKIARNKFKKTGDIVKEWFNFDDVDVDAKSLTVDDCIDVSLANITDVHSDFTLDFERKITTHLSSLKLSDIDSNNLNEVFYILLDNIYKRSGLKDKVKVRVRITKPDDEHLKISIVNKVNENVINLENINKINEIKNIISTGLYETKASDEGNSGLIKLKNMNHSDKNSILFDFKFNSFIVKYNFKLL